MTVSAFGVEHGYEISKKDPYDAGRQRRFITNMAMGGAGGAAAGNIGAKIATRGRSQLRPGRAGLAGGALMGGVGVGIVSRERKRGRIHKADQEQAEKYRRTSRTLTALGGTGAAFSGATGAIARAEGRGKDPMGFTMKETPYAKPMSTRLRTRILMGNAKAHRMQSKVGAGIGAAGLGLAGAYKVAQRKELKKDFTPEQKRRGRDTAMGAGTVGLGGASIAGGGYNAKFLGGAANAHGQHAYWSHRMIREHNTGDVRAKLTPVQLEHYKHARKVSSRVAGVKGAGAAASLGVAGLGAKAIYDVSRKKKGLAHG